MNKKANGKTKGLKIPVPLHWRLKELAAKRQKFLDEFVVDELWKVVKEAK